MCAATAVADLEDAARNDGFDYVRSYQHLVILATS